MIKFLAKLIERTGMWVKDRKDNPILVLLLVPALIWGFWDGGVSIYTTFFEKSEVRVTIDPLDTCGGGGMKVLVENIGNRRIVVDRIYFVCRHRAGYPTIKSEQERIVSSELEPGHSKFYCIRERLDNMSAARNLLYGANREEDDFLKIGVEVQMLAGGKVMSRELVPIIVEVKKNGGTRRKFQDENLSKVFLLN